MTANYPHISLPRDQILALLAGHRDPDNDHVIHLCPEGGWLIITATHVLPDGRMGDSAGTAECLAMYDGNLAKELADTEMTRDFHCRSGEHVMAKRDLAEAVLGEWEDDNLDAAQALRMIRAALADGDVKAIDQLRSDTKEN